MAHEHENHDHHHHGHSHAHAHAGGNIGVAFFLNLSFTMIEIIGGLMTNSIAIVSDAVHDFGDSISLGLSWYFEKLSKKGSTNAYSYGYKRFSLLGAIINAVVLVVGSIYILTEAVPRLRAPQATNADGMFWLAILGIIINGAAVLRTSGGRSINEKVVSLHLLEDVLGWVAVLVGSVIMRLTGFWIIDPLLSIGIAGFVLLNVYKNIRQVLPILLQGTPADVDRARIVERLRILRDVDTIHDLHIWSLDESYNVLTVHIVLSKALSPLESIQLKKKIRESLHKESIQHATIEFEAPGEECTFSNCVGH